MKLAFVVTLCLFTSLAVWSGYQQVKVIRRVEVTKYEKSTRTTFADWRAVPPTSPRIDGNTMIR
ncbi:hypothetical protein QNE28_001232 [Vibrio fluvialis]|nr:hypothetical protein [Vibrio fluvialis]